MAEINKSQLKTYAANAREDFIQAVKEKAAKFGIFADHIVPAKEENDFLIIDNLTYSRQFASAYKKVLNKIKQYGYEEAMNEIAYTWFNRMIALRYMELNKFLSHGLKVIGNERPEVLTSAEHLDLPGLNKSYVETLILNGNKDEELYAYLLKTQLSALNKSMPFLFEKIDDETNLLIPDNLLAKDSIRAKMVELDESNFEQIEVVGWLYQFYISEKKDTLMAAGKAYNKEDIPAVTQLFTPNWIVKYMVQNSLGAKWLETYPSSSIKNKMEYYIEPATQDADVQKELDKLKEERINPEEIKILDPACGSGHILVEAYDLLKEIYMDRGYNKRDIPALILKNNLYGIDIDKRASQLASFALAMKACEDNPRLMNEEISPNIICMEESNNLNAQDITQNILQNTKIDINPSIVSGLLDNFYNAKTYGSLIKVDETVYKSLHKIDVLINEATLSKDLFRQTAAEELKHFATMARYLGQKYDCVIANPPYMGSKGQNAQLKGFASQNFPNSKSDLFAMFMEHGFNLIKPSGYNAMVTMQSWMFLSSFELMRLHLLENRLLTSMAHLGARAFREISGEVVQTTSFVFRNIKSPNYKGSFLRLIDGDDIEKENNLRNKSNLYNQVRQSDFSKIPGSPIAYWVSDKIRNSYETFPPLHITATPRAGMITGNNNLFVRLWHEISVAKTMFNCQTRDEAKDSGMKWFPYQKGGAYRKWFGNKDCVINWEDDGFLLRNTKDDKGKVPAHAFNEDFIFRSNVNWSAITSSFFSARVTDSGCLFDAAGSAAFPTLSCNTYYLCSFLNSKIANILLASVNPTLNFQAWEVGNLPVRDKINSKATSQRLKFISKSDWDSFETSWDFKRLPLLTYGVSINSGLVDYPDTRGIQIKRDGNWLKENNAPINALIKTSYDMWREQNAKDVAETLRLEEENNRLFIDAYDLADEITPEVPIEQITLTVNPRYRYKTNDATDEQLEERFKADSIKELISYAIGCMMGRYSLDKDGLVYANEANIGFNPADYATFPADDDGIIPLTDTAWFADEDLVNRLVKFVETVWGKQTLAENILFIANALDKKPSETPEEAIRRYLTKDFYKDHLQTYKNRPIYWLFSSGKEKAFECLVYMHRINAQTLARIRMQFIVPLVSRIEARLNSIEQDIIANPTKLRQLEKEKDKLLKQKKELLDYDDAINHAINNKIDIDLDDGVKVNYAKFNGLLAMSTKIVGKE